MIETWRGYDVGRGPVEHNYAQQYAGLRGARFAVADTAKHFVMLDDRFRAKMTV